MAKYGSLANVLALAVIVIAILGIVGVGLPALAVWFCILVLAVAVLVP